MKSVGIGKKEIAEKAKKSGIAIDRRLVGGKDGGKTADKTEDKPKDGE